MQRDTGAGGVLKVSSLTEYFRDALQGALAHQHLSVEDQTEHYVVNVLTLFARSEALYESTSEGLRLKPLVAMLCEALEAPGTAERLRTLQRLGDVSSGRATGTVGLLGVGLGIAAALRRRRQA